MVSLTRRATVAIDRAERPLFGAVLLGAFFGVIGQNTVGMIGPFLSAEFSIDATILGTLNAFTFASMALGSIILGWVAGRAGLRQSLRWGVGFIVVGSLIGAAGDGMTAFALSRIVTGIGLGGLSTNSVATLTALVSATARGSAVSLLNVAAGGLGNVAAFLFGLGIVGVFAAPEQAGGHGWRVILIAIAVLGVIVWLTYRAIPDVTKGAAPAGAPAQASADSGALRPPLVRAAASYFVTAGCTLTVLTFLPTLLASSGGVSSSESLLLAAIVQVGGLVGACFSLLFAANGGVKRYVIGAGTLCVGVCLAIVLQGHHIAVLMTSALLFQLAGVFAVTLYWRWFPMLFSSSERPRGMGIIIGSGSLGAVGLTWAGGVLLDRGGPALLFGGIGCAYLILLVCVSFVPERPSFDRH
ncbi:MFS transporter [Pseudactinotalea sp. HY158]|uniref:MFS transporter n=1 Tax=Pseudactinotalea sp. HY158 TaxID=2654547 RepID=UPI00129CA355|nr:MFS transporter [Pseudactinotalea sp. HY158]QGH68462.1 MFS transporter [Pseudactinotalea sp. HY158]